MPTDRFDAVAAWDALSVEEQRQVGIAAMIAGACSLYESATPLGDTPGLVMEAEGAARDLVEQAVMRTRPGIEHLAVVPDVAPLGIRACRGCGCTEHYACEGGCGWVPGEEDLCTACAPKGELRAEAVDG